MLKHNKIALISGTFFPHPGGVQVEVNNIAAKLVEKKMKVTLFIFNKSTLKNTNYQIKVINKLIVNFLYILKFFFNFNIKFFFKYFKIFNDNYDIYHFHLLNYKSLILIEYLKYHKKKIIVTFHGADIQIEKEINYGFRLNHKFDKYLKKIIKKIDCFQCISNNLYKDLVKLGINKKNYKCIKFNRVRKI